MGCGWLYYSKKSDWDRSGCSGYVKYPVFGMILVVKGNLRKFKNLGHWVLAWYWVLRCGYPAKGMKVIGVTGTDGKTTTCTLIYEILKLAKKPVGMITTVAVKWVKENGSEITEEKGLHTTNPGPEELQPVLARMKDDGVKYVVLEVTSHGLDQHRVAGCNFYVAVLTNITHEHLDYHGSMEEYRKSKLKLFEFPSVQYAVLNQDDESFGYFQTKLSRLLQQVMYTKSKIKNISQALAGDYNRYNIAAAQAVASVFKIQETTIKRVIENFPGVPGRREDIKAGQNFRVIVDFAHTPNALDKILSQAKLELPEGKRLTVVFGCPGERDKSKRPLMGKAAVTWADRVIITADDPRWEDMGEIYAMATSGMTDEEKAKTERIDDRTEAVRKAIAGAGEGDIVVLAGKGHERSLAVRGVEIPWSDAGEARKDIMEGHA